MQRILQQFVWLRATKTHRNSNIKTLKSEQDLELRDFSLYSTSTNEGSIGKAQHDLDRCAQILNEVLDNGAGILDGVKKRKSQSSPNKDISSLHHKKVRQTNRLIGIENKTSTPGTISSSTPQQTRLVGARRHRSSSASSICSYSLGSGRQKRNRSLSEQRGVPTSAQRSLRTCRSLSAQRRTTGSIMLDSVRSVFANQSMTSSEADTLTGLHLDNSSQFGIPPVFTGKGEKRSRRDVTKSSSRRTRSTHRCSNVGWLKPQSSISTQTLENDAEAQPAAKSSLKKLTSNKVSSEREVKRPGAKKTMTINIPSSVQTNLLSAKVGKPELSSSGKVKLSPAVLTRPLTRVTCQKENDVDDLLERTLTEGQTDPISTQMEVEELISQRGFGSGDRSEDQVRKLLDRLQTASESEDNAVFRRELGLVGSTMHRILRESTHPPRTSVDQLLMPFQRESQELREQVQELKQQLTMLQQTGKQAGRVTRGSDNQLSCDLSLKVVAAEAHNDQLSNQLADMITELNEEKRKVAQLTNDVQYYAEQVDDLKRENKQLHLDLSSRTTEWVGIVEGSKAAEDAVKLTMTNQKLQTLQQSVRLFHTRLTHIASQCDVQTSKHLTSVLELCAHRLIESMDDPLSQISHDNHNNNSKWENKPENLAEVVSANLARSRVEEGLSGRVRTQSNPARSAGGHSLALPYSDYHPTTGLARSLDYPPVTTSLPSERIPDALPNGNLAAVGKPDKVASDSRYSMTQYFQKYHPDYASAPNYNHVQSVTHPRTVPLKRGEYLGAIEPWQTNTKEPCYSSTTASQEGAPTSCKPIDYKHYPCSMSTSPASTCISSSSEVIPPVSQNEQLHSTLVSGDSDSTLNADVDVLSEASTLSMATTVADNVFQEGLAQLDANIAKLQHSLRTSRLGSTL